MYRKGGRIGVDIAEIHTVVRIRRVFVIDVQPPSWSGLFVKMSR